MTGASCQQRCTRHPKFVAKKKINFAYQLGFKKCFSCEGYYFKVDFYYCPCCNSRLTCKSGSISKPRRMVLEKHFPQKRM